MTLICHSGEKTWKFHLTRLAPTQTCELHTSGRVRLFMNLDDMCHRMQLGEKTLPIFTSKHFILWLCELLQMTSVMSKDGQAWGWEMVLLALCFPLPCSARVWHFLTIPENCCFIWTSNSEILRNQTSILFQGLFLNWNSCGYLLAFSGLPVQMKQQCRECKKASNCGGTSQTNS